MTDLNKSENKGESQSNAAGVTDFREDVANLYGSTLSLIQRIRADLRRLAKEEEAKIAEQQKQQADSKILPPQLIVRPMGPL